MLDTLPDSASSDAPIADLGPLAWVFDELRKSLEGANKAIRRFVRETEQSRHSDLESADAGSLRLARQQLHQAVGALEMVGLTAPAQVMRAMEAAVQRFVQKPQQCTDAAATTVERASFALIEYLEAVLNNKPVPPVALFAQYRDVQELAAAERVHPADLWPFDARGIDLSAPAGVSAMRADAQMRSLFDRVVLLMIKSQSPAAAGQLARMSAGLAVGADAPRVTTFWRVAAAYFEAVALKLVPPDVYVKRAASRILLQLAALAQAKSPGDVSETLLHDLLFFCAQARPQDPQAAPHLHAVRTAFGLSGALPVDYHQATLGQFDPALLVQARKRINAGKESWSLLSGGDLSRARAVQDQYSLIGDSLLRLHPASAVLARTLVKAAEQVARSPAGLKPELSMEMATTTLYLEAVFDDFDPNDLDLTLRTQALAERLDRVLAGEPAQPLEPWMEQLYRRVSDRQTMGSVVGELKASLGEAEKSLDQFFRAPREKACLHVAVSQLVQMRGVLSVLGLDQAVYTVTRMRNTVEQILDTEVDEVMARQAGTFHQLGNNLSALSFLVDMLNYQPLLAKKLFVFDEASGELRPVMGRTAVAAPVAASADDDARAISAGVQRVVAEVQNGSVDLAALQDQLGTLADQASLIDHQGVARAAREAAHAVVGSDAQAGAQALVGLSQTGVAPAPSVAPPVAEDDDEDDLRGIFLEEAREVLAHGREAVASLVQEPAHMEHLTTLRRAFHTLKGSSRMVGLMEFGEASWAMEQVLNAVLAEQGRADASLRALAEDSLGELARWVEDIAQLQDAEWRAQPFRVSAEAWRNQGYHLPIGVTEGVYDTPASDLGEATSLEVETEGAQEPAAWDRVDFVSTAPMGLEADAGALDGMRLPLAEGLAQPERDSSRDTLLMPLELPESRPERSDDGTSEGDPGSGSDGPPSIFDGIALDLAAELPQAPDLRDMAPGPTFHPDDPDSVLVSEFPEDAISEEPTPASDVGAPDAVSEAGIETERDEPPADVPDEQTRQIGPLRIGIRLYNVYLNEADEWSRRLGTTLGEWALERHEPVPEAAEAWAHSLAGSSATVGFQPLSDIARALEHALSSVALHQRAGQVATAEHAQLFVDAAEDIRRLLHQFAAGFFKEPQAELLAALDRLVHQPAPLETEPGSSEGDDQDLDIEINTQWGVEPQSDQPVDLAQVVPVAGPSNPTAFEPSRIDDADTLLSPLPDPFEARGPVQDIDDDIDALDTIDVDLFPIFADEAQELLPRLGGALRQWMARPDNGSARAEVLRNLHTLKGSARLAGALRLGEMAHRMETAVERMGSAPATAGEIEPLQASYDALNARFELLRNNDFSSTGVVQTAPELADRVQAVSPGSPEAAEPAQPAAQAGVADPNQVDAVPEVEVSTLPQEPAGPGLTGLALMQAPVPAPQRAGAAVRVRPELLDRLVNQTGEVMITRSRMESQLVTLRGSLKDLTGNLDRLRHQLRDIELQAETQMQSRLAQARDAELSFDPLEFDRFTRVQELTRMMAESVNDVATVQRNLQRAVEATEDGLVAQGRQTRELQRDLLRTRMVEFEGISERLYRVVRQASKETGKQVRLDIVGGHIEMDRGVLDRMTAAFEHLLRNSVVHGIESPEQRLAQGKAADGRIEIRLAQELNDVSVVFQDDGAGLDLPRVREKALQQGLLDPGATPGDEELAQLVFAPGLSTANEVSSLAGRGVGMDVVRTDVIALGGRIETQTRAGQGCSFKLVLPLTTAVTQVVMLRAGSLTIGVPSTQVELVRRVGADELEKAYARRSLTVGAEEVPFYWAGALLQSSAQTQEPQGRTLPVVIFRSAAQRVALHVDEVLGNQEVVVKNLGPQLSRLPGLAGMSVLASGAVALIYNPVALATVYGAQVQPWIEGQRQHVPAASGAEAELSVEMAVSAVPLVLVVDDSITVRRVTQRLLQREGYRVTLAADGLQALERLQQERPTVVLSDIEMPRMDGFDLVRNIRNDPRLASLPVIMITSRIAEKHREHARELGVNHYLGKPYSEDELVALIGHYAHAHQEA